MEHLLGESIPASKLNDNTLGRVLDRLSDVGTNKNFGSFSIKVMKSFELDRTQVHHDTTSHSVYGDVSAYEWDGNDHLFMISPDFSESANAVSFSI